MSVYHDVRHRALHSRGTLPAVVQGTFQGETMKIEIKNLKHSEFASRETHCYEATVWVDGSRSFIAENDGHGGADLYTPLKGGTMSEVNAVLKRIADHHRPKLSKRNPIIGTEDNEWIEKLSVDAIAEIVINDLVTQKLMGRDLKKSLKKVVLYRDNNDGKVYEASFRGVKQIEQRHIDKVIEENPNSIALNSLPFDEALKVYVEALQGAM